MFRSEFQRIIWVLINGELRPTYVRERAFQNRGRDGVLSMRDNASLPKHIAGAGAIFHDAADRILLVKLSYREGTWEISGGGLDKDEDPRQAVQREIKEELGFGLTPAASWSSTGPQQPDGRPPPLPFSWPRNGAPGLRARHDCCPLSYA
ncbi:NUDIX domain-containing protein [Streptomyces sp. NPDC097727]|uniref:NUDIX domain-containing protein n=1 Tax=Streptomyces sp. NPDC097727 TaxID=3366092 RepID=UPI0037F24689